MLSIVLALLSTASAPLNPDDAGGHPVTDTPPPSVEMLLPDSVDHEEVMVEYHPGANRDSRGAMLSDYQQVVIRRSGSWTHEIRRIGDEAEDKYENFATGLQIWRTNIPTMEEIFVNRYPADRIGSMVSRTKIDDTDQLLGETCSVYTIKNQGTGFEYQNCLTSDNVLLWSKMIAQNGKIIYSLIAKSVSRHKMPDNLVLPPQPIAVEAYWHRLFYTFFDPAKTPNYRVSGIEYLNPHDTTMTWSVSRLGPASLSDFKRKDGRTTALASWPVFISYSTDTEGRPVLLDMRRSTKPANQAINKTPPLKLSPESRGLRKSEIVSGEKCEWNIDDTGPDSYKRECRTRDGIPVKMEENGYVAGPTYLATEIRRGDVTKDQLWPHLPLRLNDWAPYPASN